MFYSAPKLTILARPVFTEPDHLPVNWLGESSDGEKLAEFAGRLCYMSQRNPANRETRDYLENIKRQGHGSVLEHANYSVLAEGVSRSLTHELVRHRAGWGYSQLSQRYVDESEAHFVIPPAILEDEALEKAWKDQMATAQTAYVQLVEQLMERYSWVADKIHRRKMAREAARGVLPNSTETKIVMTGNARAWRTMLELRSSEGAELEIRRFAVAALRSKPPAGRALWTMELLAGEMVRLTKHKALSSETVRRRLVEKELKPWQKKMWCIPKVDTEFVARMEDV